MGLGTIMVPGANGGGNIGGISIDQSRSIGVMVVNVMLGGLCIVSPIETIELLYQCGLEL